MEKISVPLYSKEGNQIDTIELESQVFGTDVNTAAIYQAVHAYNANQRKGLAATKTRGEVSGGGRKPWRQKGTGRARVGSTRSPLWRHGGVVFGPHPRDFSYTLPAKIKDVALKSAVLAKAQENNLIVVEDFTLPKATTKEAAKIFSNLKINLKKTRRNALLVCETLDNNLKMELRNISGLNIDVTMNINAYEVFANKKLIFTKDALMALKKRLQK